VTVKRFFEMDFSLLFAAMILTVFGILFIYSSGITSTGVLVSNEYLRQIIWAIAGLSVAIVLSLSDYRKLLDISVYVYLATLGFLVYTIFFGRLVNGARAWLGVGTFGIQPSEFAKIATILLLSRYLVFSSRSQNDLKRFLTCCLIVFTPVVLILLQPDLGTALVFIPILLVTTYIAGISIKYVIYTLACIIITGLLTIMPLWQTHIMKGSLPSLMILSNFSFILTITLSFISIALIAFFGYVRYKKKYFYWIAYVSSIIVFSIIASFLAHKVLKEYQIMRLIVFLDPYIDPRGSGWNIIQSVTAIGSGGVIGKGFLQGTQSHYRFLPQQSTDFIFSIFSEEWGFIGGVLVFSLFLVICLRLIRIMKTTSDPFGAFIAAGLSSMYSFHFLVNVGMAMGVMPITGIPLVFMSYGGSSLLAAMVGIGLASSVYIRRYEH
jgi:rod shape determining protein RodA